MPLPVQSPEKELRFTRSGQAPLFWVAAAVLCAAAIILGVCAGYRGIDPRIPHPLWAAIPLACAWASARTAIRLTRHAYLILTPLGIEIFPFFRPADGMRMVAWSEIHTAEITEDQGTLTLHYNAERSSGIHLSLKPIRADRRLLLAQAIAGRVTMISLPTPTPPPL